MYCTTRLNVKKLYLLPTENICVFCVDLSTGIIPLHTTLSDCLVTSSRCVFLIIKVLC
jgi:hypothetical protein